MNQEKYQEDKENIKPTMLYNTKIKPLTSNKSSRRGFGNLLHEANQEAIEEIDEKIAVKSQCKDIYDMVNKLCVDFEREDKDAKMAESMHKNELNIEKSRKDMKKMDEQKNEAVALRIAIEERKRIAKLAQSKREMEESDEKYARQSILDDLDADYKYQNQCKDDEKIAFQLREQLELEELAKELEEREQLNNQYQQETDEEIANQLHQKLLREMELEESKLLEEDYLLAQEIESNLNKHTEINESEDDRLKQKMKDSELSKKLITNKAREIYQQSKYQKIQKEFDYHNMKAIAAQWTDCDVHIENVMNGLCITLLLPHLNDLKVKIKQNNTVTINAKRMILPGDKNATKDNSNYRAEFEIRGNNVKISESDINYNYSSETGLLHIYIERVEMKDDNEEKAVDEKESDDSKLSFSKRSFLRLFNY